MDLSHLEFLSPEKGFLGLPKSEVPDVDDCKAVIVPFGLEESVTYGGGTSKGPEAIIKASPQLEMFDDEHWCEPYKNIGIATMKPFPIHKDIESALTQLEEIIADLLKAGKFPLTLGGEHSITAGAIRPFAEKYKDLAILHFDAHADLRDGFEGVHYSHASALRRCLDNPDITLVSCGIRNISQSEIPFLEENHHRVKIYWAREKQNWNVQEIVSWLKGRPVYVTFDLDGFDASLMPATGTPEPGGLFWDQAIEIIREASRVSDFVGADIVELAPVPQLHFCDFLAAKLAYKILGYAFNNNY